MKIRWFPITAALAAADQAAKCYAENKLAKGEERAITDKVVLRHVQNEGVCMSLLEDEPETARILAGAAFGSCARMACLYGCDKEEEVLEKGRTFIDGGRLDQ